MTLQERLSPGRYRLRVEDYERIAEAGAFGDARTELIAGEIIVMSPEYCPHAWAKDELHYRLRRALEASDIDLRVSSGSVLVSDHDMPLPDIMLRRAWLGEGAIPREAVALVVEVSATTQVRDMRRKARLYAEARVPEYWVADLRASVIRQMWNPSGGAYLDRRDVPIGDRLAAATIATLEVETGGLN